MMTIQIQAWTVSPVMVCSRVEGETTNTAVTRINSTIEKMRMTISMTLPAYFPESFTMDCPLLREEIIPEK